MKLGFFFNSRTDGLDIMYGGNVFSHATLKNNVLVLDLDDCYDNNKTSSAFVSYNDSFSDSVKCHARLGHIDQDRMNMLAKEGHLDRLTEVKLPRYESYLASKATKKPFGKASRATCPLELIHSDICRHMSVKVRHADTYFLTFIDNYSRYGYVYLLSHRYEVLDVFKRLLVEVETQLERKFKTLRTDRGREYLSNLFKEFCEK